jgi:hypothetical protein
MRTLLKITSLLTLLSLVSCDQKRYSIDEIVCSNDSIWHMKYDSSLVNGIVYNNHVKIGSIINGHISGSWRNPNEKGEFENYISLKQDVFYNGESSFYPMVMNYSVDVFSSNKDSSNHFYASPRKGYHPSFGNKTGESTTPWGSDSVKMHAIIKSHFTSINDMGFNAIRLTGFTATDAFNNGFDTWTKIDVSNSKAGIDNITNGLIPLLKTILQYAEENQLRVILLLSAVETQEENQLNFLSTIAKGLSKNKTIMAYDLYNEPIYFDRGDYTKKETTTFVERYNKAIKDASPNHLTTIGLTHYKIVHEWDPELMDVDFLSFHCYPYWSKNLSLLERFESKLYWISKNISKPWIVGETGLNTLEECDPLNLASGTVEDQLTFINYSLSKFRSAGASGYSWWSFQDTREQLEGDCPQESCYGLVHRTKEYTYLNSNKEEILGKLKHEVNTLPFKEFRSSTPYEIPFWGEIRKPKDEHYYNIDYLPNHKKAFGRVVNQDGTPIEDAIITLVNTESKSQYSTFSKSDGTFCLNTGWTNIFTHPDFILKVTAVTMETIEYPIGVLSTDKKQTLKDLALISYQ